VRELTDENAGVELADMVQPGRDKEADVGVVLEVGGGLAACVTLPAL
jgi:hypothetical protein